MSTWYFTARDNGGKFQGFKIKAADKKQAIDKGFFKARKQARGAITSWNCTLHSVL